MELTFVPAYFLDLMIGDPRGYPHPVKIMGLAIQRLESLGRKWCINPFLAGTAITLIIVASTYYISWGLIKALDWLNPLAGTVGSIVLIYTTISIRDLYEASRPVLSCLQEGNLATARESLSMIVGRDTQNMDQTNIIKATIETIAESTVDGIVSPLFYACIGGAPLALAYKAVSTLDSMIGHNDATYCLFGKFAARLDDVANFIPARLGGIIIVLASIICGHPGSHSLRVMIRDGQNHLSPNSGIPEAAFAGALGLQLGGDSFYAGEKIAKPFIGDATQTPDIQDIVKCHKIMLTASGITLAVLIAARIFLGQWASIFY